MHRYSAYYKIILITTIFHQLTLPETEMSYDWFIHSNVVNEDVASLYFPASCNVKLRNVNRKPSDVGSIFTLFA